MFSIMVSKVYNTLLARTQVTAAATD